MWIHACKSYLCKMVGRTPILRQITPWTSLKAPLFSQVLPTSNLFNLPLNVSTLKISLIYYAIGLLINLTVCLPAYGYFLRSIGFLSSAWKYAYIHTRVFFILRAFDDDYEQLQFSLQNMLKLLIDVEATLYCLLLRKWFQECSHACLPAYTTKVAMYAWTLLV